VGEPKVHEVHAGRAAQSLVQCSGKERLQLRRVNWDQMGRPTQKRLGILPSPAAAAEGPACLSAGDWAFVECKAMARRSSSSSCVCEEGCRAGEVGTIFSCRGADAEEGRRGTKAHLLSRDE